MLMMNFLSSFTFFAGLEVGKIYAHRFLIEGKYKLIKGKMYFDCLN